MKREPIHRAAPITTAAVTMYEMIFWCGVSYLTRGVKEFVVVIDYVYAGVHETLLGVQFRVGGVEHVGYERHVGGIAGEGGVVVAFGQFHALLLGLEFLVGLG